MRVATLCVYPVKSCGALPLESAALDRFGLENDRRYAFRGPEGRLLTQREHPLMAEIRPLMVEKQLLLDLAGLMQVPIAQSEHPVSEFLGLPVRLAAGSFPDAEPVLIASLGTLELIGADMARFRANVVIEGAEPLAELGWASLHGADAALHCASRCERCAMVGAATLRRLHQSFGGEFGVYCRIAQPGRLERGETLRSVPAPR